MSELRFVKTQEQLIEAAENNLEFFDANMHAIKAWYKTEPGLIEKLIPAPLKPHADPMVRIVISRVFVDLNGGMEFGAATFGVNCMYQGKEGIYEITMPMETEGVVVGGRETYGEPKKIADVTASKEGDECVATVTRHGITYLELKGKTSDELDTSSFTDDVYCFKVFPSCEQNKAVDQNPLLVRINMHRTQSVHTKLEGEIILRESPMDPVIDLPVKEMISLVWEEGTSSSNASVVEEVDAMSYVPFMHSRYDSA